MRCRELGHVVTLRRPLGGQSLEKAERLMTIELNSPSLRRCLSFFMLGVLAACGGGESKPPESPTTPAPTEDKAATPPKRDELGGPVAASSSEDVKKGISALKASDVAAAKAAFEAAIQKNPKQADAHHYLGVVEEQLGHKSEAEKSYRKALELKPDLEESAVNLAALLVESGKFEEAAALMRKAIAKNSRSAALHINLGMALSGKNDDAGASKAFEEAIKLEPNNGIHLVTYASHLVRSGKKDDAINRLKQAEKVAATDPGVLASVALEYKDLKDFKSCVAVLDKAIGHKDIAELRIYRGTCKLGLRDLPGATAEFSDAVAKDPNNALAHYSLGNALADSGKLPEAIAEWEEYLKREPSGPHSEAATRKIAIAKSKGPKRPKK